MAISISILNLKLKSAATPAAFVLWVFFSSTVLSSTAWLSIVLPSMALPFIALADEPYKTRPDILSVEAKEHTGLIKSWNQLKRGHIEAVAELLEMHPSGDLYFLARDTELLYDMAKLATHGTSYGQIRLHYLNISLAESLSSNSYLHCRTQLQPYWLRSCRY